MISASTLLLATLVFSSASSVLGAPIRIVDTVPRAVTNTPSVEPVARADVVDVEGLSGRGEMSRRTARLVTERDEPFSEFIEVREPADVAAPVEQKREVRARRYARRIIHDFLEAREPSPAPVPVEPKLEERQRAYPRRILHEFYEKREPATSIKETTLVFSKTTVHDTPADAAAAHAAKGDASPSPNVVTIPIPSAPAIPCTDSTVSVTQSTVIIPGPAATPVAVPVVAPGSVTPSPAVAASSSPAAGGVVAPVVAPAVAPPTVVAAPVTGPAVAGAVPVTTPASASELPSTGAPTVASPAPAGNVTPPSPASETPATPAAPVSPAGGDVPPAPPAPATESNNNTPPASAEPTVGGPTSTPARRDAEPASQPLARRLAMSGPSFASSVRRSTNSQ